MIRILHLSKAADRASALGLRAAAGKAPEVPGAVAEIIADVRARGDVAVRALTERFDGARLESLFLEAGRWDALAAQCPPAVRQALELAHRRVRAFHAPQIPPSYSLELEDGGVLRSLTIPLRRAACYVPGGRAAYPSTVIMTVTVARLAGVPEVIVATPPRRDGAILPEVAAAARIAGATRILLAGGAQAIAALALGTASVPRVDVIVGPGNAYVTEAKKQLAGEVRIDSLAGPTEVAIVADSSADPAADRGRSDRPGRARSPRAQHPDHRRAALAERTADALRRELPGSPESDRRRIAGGPRRGGDRPRPRRRARLRRRAGAGAPRAAAARSAGGPRRRSLAPPPCSPATTRLSRSATISPGPTTRCPPAGPRASPLRWARPTSSAGRT